MATKISKLDNLGIAVLEPRGALIGDKETDELKTSARQLLEGGSKKLIIDLGDVDYINSSGLGALVSIYTTYTNNGARIKLCRMGKNIHNIFVITKLTSVFDVEETREAAIKNFQ